LPAWNLAIRLAVYLAMTYFLVELLAARRRNEELSGLIIHDLRSPLANIMAGLDLLRYGEIEQSAGERETVIELCLASGHRMLTLIQSLLDTSRLEAGRMPLHVEDVRPLDLVESALGQMSLAASRSNVAVESSVEPDSQCVHADRVLTERMLVNLLANALKYSPPGGRIVLSASAPNAREVAFSVADEGPGVPAEWSRRVFDRFAQVEGRGSGGSGLGLAFCAMASKIQGGRIWLESRNGNGTTVTFTLPVGHIT
jgi:signal transduction histidine kinase